MSATSTVILLLSAAAAVLAQDVLQAGPNVLGAQVATGVLGAAAKANGLQQQREFPVRDLPADTLRDFPGVCFGSTTFRFYQIGDTWSLAPFCGLATCLTDGRHLIERVRDCGLMPKENPKCKISNLNARNETFPSCCPKFKCDEGVELEYPTPEELQAFAQQAHQAQLAAAATQQQQQVQLQQQVQQQVLQQVQAARRTPTIPGQGNRAKVQGTRG